MRFENLLFLHAGATIGAALLFALIFLPAGYLASFLILDSRTDRGVDRFLWSLPLSVPLVVLLSVGLCSWMDRRAAGCVMMAVAAVAAGVCVVRFARTKKLRRPGRYVLIGLALAMGLAVYVSLATAPVQHGARVYESVVAADWGVRVPLVRSMMEHGLPAINPFSSLHGVSPHLRYYFYWYVVCAVPAALFHLDPRDALGASCVWAMLAVGAMAVLLLKTLFRPREPVAQRPFGWLALLMLPVSFILGLDIVAVAGGMMLPHPVLYPEMEWWRSGSDFAPSFHTMGLYGPHHIAGLVMAVLSYVLLLPSERRERCGPAAAVLAGCCFAASVGCSTFMAMFSAIAFGLLAWERWKHGDRERLRMMALAACTAAVLSAPLAVLLAHAPSGSDPHPGEWAPAVMPIPNSSLMPSQMLEHMRKDGMVHGERVPMWLECVFFLPAWMALLLMEAGFFLWIVVRRWREDWRSGDRPDERVRWQWMLFAAFLFPFAMLNTSGIAGPNDLARHAGFGLRLICVLWATPVVAEFLLTASYRRRVFSTWKGRTAVAAAVLGVCAQAWQIGIQRSYLYLADRGATPYVAQPFPSVDHVARYFYDLKEANDAAAAYGRQGGLLMMPESRMGTAMQIYLTRHPVAMGGDCMGAFGGDWEMCRREEPAIRRMFGGDEERASTSSDRSMEAFAALCVRHHAALAMATDTDPAWRDAAGFVWQGRAVYASEHVRLMACPETARAGRD